MVPSERGDHLVRSQRLARAGHDALLDEVDDSVGEQLRVDAEVAVIAERDEHRVRNRPMPTWSVAPWGSRSTIRCAIASPRSSGTAGGISASGLSRSHQPSSWEAWT
jgi:hypothetical protein